MYKYFIAALLGYASGSVMYSYYLPLIFKGVDIIKLSDDHNPGMTNVMIYCGKPMGLLCLLLDFLKGFIPVYISCGLLDTARRVGIHVTPSFLMNPSKSVTAVIGLSDKPQMARIRGCAWCVMRNTCTLRKGGKSCGL